MIVELVAGLGSLAYVGIGAMFVAPLVHLYALGNYGEDSPLAGAVAGAVYTVAWPLAALAVSADVAVRVVKDTRRSR